MECIRLELFMMMNITLSKIIYNTLPIINIGSKNTENQNHFYFHFHQTNILIVFFKLSNHMMLNLIETAA